MHWPNDPNMPGMLQIEALVQMCALSLLTLPGNKGKLVYLISADKIKKGDHIIFICQVSHVVNNDKLKPLIYYKSKYF